ncbi:hypothetical protein [Flavobacterium sp.]|uniref:hypothetical protein n=1 Tax=Flavobacterium sp. TaxID=239 RepID=UPI00120BADC5|nr:hypothetical protein [Flavobacterium sp.]RZJ71748.1 MAG: hypothetical protein EOO49_08780 [Flavobacterium sp.]
MDAVQQMVDWVSHPLEFGRAPDTVRLLDQKELFWITQHIETCYLVEFTFGDDYYIGFTGPITWCFLAIDFKKLTFRELYERYAGWHIAFSEYNNPKYDKSKQGKDEAKLVARLVKHGYKDIRTIENTYISKQNYYEFAALKNDKPVTVVCTNKTASLYENDYILPYFDFIGKIWDPFYIE